MWYRPQTLYRGLAPGPHWGLTSPDSLFCGVQKNPYIILCIVVCRYATVDRYEVCRVATYLPAYQSSSYTNVVAGVVQQAGFAVD